MEWRPGWIVLASCLAACSTNSHLQYRSVDAVDAVETQIVYLSGTGRDNPVLWDFYCTEGRNCGEWSEIAVPSNWELQGFGNYNYGHDAPKHDEQGRYRRTFEIPAHWADRTVEIVFEGVMTDTQVFVNGQPAGGKHQGGFYRFDYDITPLIRVGETNTLEVVVDKVSSDRSVELAERKADYWVFGGIFRPVYLRSLPHQHITWMSVDAQSDGSFALDVHVDIGGERRANRIEAQILDVDGAPVGRPFEATIVNSKARLLTEISSPKQWTAETPDLYRVSVKLMQDDAPVHRTVKRFGFRTFQVREGEGLYLNGKKIVLKGVNRHSFRPDSGRTLSPDISIEDIRLIKSMNMNAVRMAHYPPDEHFLAAADELGLYVIDELSTWQYPPYDLPVAERLIAQMVKRDQMHPSILMWANGNEGGWNTGADGDFDKYDIQGRPVIHPWESFGGIDTDHYPTYEELRRKPAKAEIFMPTEFLHGLYDGGHGAGLRDFWDVISGSPLGAGGFLWALADEGVKRLDQGGRIDTDGNHAPDGIVGPHGEPEGSFFTIKETWSPVWIANLRNGDVLPDDFQGHLVIENRYDFIDLSGSTLEWRLYPPNNLFSPQGLESEIVAAGSQLLPSIQPHRQGTVALDLPSDWRQAGSLELTVNTREGQEIWTWSWPIATPQAIAEATAAAFRHHKQNELSDIDVEFDADFLHISVADLTLVLDRNSGLLHRFHRAGRKAMLTGGPHLIRSDDTELRGDEATWLPNDPTTNEAAASSESTELRIDRRDDKLLINVVNPPKGFTKLVWTVHARGFVSLDVDYRLNGRYVLHGITFSYPETAIRHKRWLGDGPYRVWGNRREGVTFGVWESHIDIQQTDSRWQYPEFQGYYSDVHWISLSSDDEEIGFSTSTPGLFTRVLQPRSGDAPENTLIMEFDGEVSFLHRIHGIGTKFYKAQQLGPQGQAVEEHGIRSIAVDIY